VRKSLSGIKQGHEFVLPQAKSTKKPKLRAKTEKAISACKRIPEMDKFYKQKEKQKQKTCI